MKKRIEVWLLLALVALVAGGSTVGAQSEAVQRVLIVEDTNNPEELRFTLANQIGDDVVAYYAWVGDDTGTFYTDEWTLIPSGNLQMVASTEGWYQLRLNGPIPEIIDYSAKWDIFPGTNFMVRINPLPPPPNAIREISGCGTRDALTFTLRNGGQDDLFTVDRGGTLSELNPVWVPQVDGSLRAVQDELAAIDRLTLQDVDQVWEQCSPEWYISEQWLVGLPQLKTYLPFVIR